MREHDHYYLSDFIALTHPSNEVIDNIIQQKHAYILIKQQTGNEYLISSAQYKSKSFEYSAETGLAALVVIYNNKEYQVNEIIEMIGFREFDIALDYCGEKTDCLCTAPEEKLIFSPQLTKWLLKHHFRITDIKEKNDGSKQIIHIFLVEPGFYKSIKEWKEKG